MRCPKASSKPVSGPSGGGAYSGGTVAALIVGVGSEAVRKQPDRQNATASAIMLHAVVGRHPITTFFHSSLLKNQKHTTNDSRNLLL